MAQEVYAWVEVAPGRRRRVKINPEDIETDIPIVERSHSNGASAKHDTQQTLPKRATHVEERSDGTYAVFEDGTSERVTPAPPTPGALPAPPTPLPENMRRMNPRPTDVSRAKETPTELRRQLTPEGVRPLPKKLLDRLNALPDNWLLIRTQGQTQEVEAIHYPSQLNAHVVANMLVNAMTASRMQENALLEQAYGQLEQLQAKVTELTALLAEGGK